MIKRTILRVGLAVLLLAFVLPGAGCGNEPDATPTEPQRIIPEGPFGTYEPAITLTSVRDIPNPAFVKYPEGDDITNNVWIRSIEKDLGIRVQYLWTVDSSQLVTRQNTMIASKQFPDFFYVTAGQFRQLAEEGLLYDMTEAFDTYASEDVKRVYSEGGPAAMDSARIDNRLMAIPWIAMAKEDAQLLWIRTDWLEKVGKSMPTTMDELVDVAIAFATGDPDGNGKNDTFGLPVNGMTEGGLMWHKGFFNGYGAYPFAWIRRDGQYVYGSVQPEARAALAKLAELYARKDSTIDLEFVNKNYFTLYEPLSAGKFGIAYGPYYISISPLQPVRTRNPAAEWEPIPLVSVSGEPARVQTNLDVAGYWIVSKECRTPEAIVKLLNYWYQKFYFNTSQEDYEAFINGPVYSGIYNNSPILSYRTWNNVEAYLQVQEVLDGKKGKEELGPIPFDYYTQMQKYLDGDDSAWSALKCYEAVMGGLLHYRDNNLYEPDQSYFTVSDLTAQKFSALQAKEREVYVKIIMGEADISEFDEFVAEWTRLGGEDMIREVNEWFANQADD